MDRKLDAYSGSGTCCRALHGRQEQPGSRAAESWLGRRWFEALSPLCFKVGMLGLRAQRRSTGARQGGPCAGTACVHPSPRLTSRGPAALHRWRRTTQWPAQAAAGCPAQKAAETLYAAGAAPSENCSLHLPGTVCVERLTNHNAGTRRSTLVVDAVLACTALDGKSVSTELMRGWLQPGRLPQRACMTLQTDGNVARAHEAHGSTGT